MKNRLLEAIRRNPVRVATVLASVVVFLASALNLGPIDHQGVVDALLLTFPILAGGEVARAQVTPTRR